jgi:hypothetical protein
MAARNSNEPHVHMVLAPCVSLVYRLGSPIYKLQVNIKSGAYTNVLSHALQHGIQPPNQGLSPNIISGDSW